MFIATRAARSAKLRRSGTIRFRSATAGGRWGPKSPFMPLLTELAVCVAEDACKVQAKAALPEDAQGQIILL